MEKMSKRFIFALLTTVVVFGAFVFGLSEVDWSDFAVEAEAATPYTNGYYTYTVDSKGNATITSVDTAISGDVVIPSELDGNNVTEIKGRAFDACVDITSITIPEGLKTLGANLFNGCSGLKTVNYNAINAETTKSSYGEYWYSAFQKNDSICEVNFGENVEYIPVFLFEGCTGITEITIPENVTSIGSYAFRGCYNISTLNFNAINCTSTGGSFSYTVDEYDNPLTPILKKITIGNKVEIITSRMFYGSEIEEIVLPDSIKTIGSRAFGGCTELKHINIPRNTTFIGKYAFSYCRSLESVTIDAVNAEIESDDTFGNGCTVFYECGALKTVTIGPDLEVIPSENGKYTDSLFSYNKNITTLNFNARSCRDSNRFFYGCSNLTDINIGSDVEKLHKYTFEGTAYYNDENNWTIEELKPEEGWGVKNKTLYIDNCLVAVETAVLDFSVSDGTRLIADEVVSGKKCESVTIPDSVKFIGEKAFWCCNSVKEISLSANVERIDYLAFGNMRALESITVDPDNKYYSSDEIGVLFNKDKTELIQYPVGNERQVYYVPDGVIKACCNCSFGQR